MASTRNRKKTMNAEQFGQSIADRCGVEFRLLSGRSVLGRFRTKSGREVGFLSSYAGQPDGGNFWIDLTCSQMSALRDFKETLVAFRLEGVENRFFQLSDLRPQLSESAVIYNDHEGDHWKLTVTYQSDSFQISVQTGETSSISVTDDPCQFLTAP